MFTYADMRRLYTEHGAALSWFTDDGEGPYSANPADYWNHKDDDELPGELRVRVPETYERIK